MVLRSVAVAVECPHHVFSNDFSMTSFREPLHKICEAVEGTLAAALMGVDGIAVDLISTNETASDELLIEYSEILPQATKCAQMLSAGSLKELVIHTQNLSCVMRLVNSSYYLALILKKNAQITRGSHYLNLAAHEFEANLA